MKGTNVLVLLTNKGNTKIKSESDTKKLSFSKEEKCNEKEKELPIEDTGVVNITISLEQEKTLKVGLLMYICF